MPGKMKDQVDFKDYVEVEDKNVSPNRLQPTKVRNAIDVIANYVQLIPTMNVKFSADTFILSTQRYIGPSEHGAIQKDTRAEFDTVVKEITKKLTDEDFKPKIEFVSDDYQGMGWNTWRNVLTICRATYQIVKV